MKTALLVIALLIAFTAIAEKRETRKFVVLYTNDEGRSPYVSYPEGGGPHIYATHAQFFDSRAEAVKWLNNSTDQEGSLFHSSGYPSLRADNVIGIFAVAEVPVKFAETGKTYETYEQKSEKVVKHVKEWQ